MKKSEYILWIELNRTLRNSWDAIKRQTEAISEEHLEAHQALVEAANRVSEFADKQKGAKRQVRNTALSLWIVVRIADIIFIRAEKAIHLYVLVEGRRQFEKKY